MCVRLRSCSAQLCEVQVGEVGDGGELQDKAQAEARPLLVTPSQEFPFIDAVHKGHWEKFGVKCLADNGIAYDFSRRGLPPFKVRLVEGLKALVFAIFPHTLIVRVQNVLKIGKTERK